MAAGNIGLTDCGFKGQRYFTCGLDREHSVRRTSNAHAKGHFAKKFYVSR